MPKERILSLLKMRPEEAQMAGLVALLFALIELGRGIGGSAADALFFTRFGVDYLPYLYIVLGITTFIVSLSYAAFLGRFNKQRFFTVLLAAMALVLLLERAAILLDIRALYPLLWLTVNLIGALLGTVAWNTAGDVCDTRQAKRLFPLFVSAGIAGGLVGSLLIGPMAAFLGTENLILIDALLLACSVLVIRRIAQRYFPATQPHDGSSFVADIRTGFDYVRRSPLLVRLSVSAILFSILYFSVSFPFGRAVAASFSSEAEIAGFLGLFSGITSALMFVAALLIANRLYARIGVVAALLILPLTYLFGFTLFAVKFSLVSAIIVRLSQLVVLSGIGDGAYSTFFNVVPAEKRAQVRAFDAGVPAQVGTIASGVMLILGERALTNAQIFGMGMVVALLCAYVVWQMRRSYAAALIAALRSGRIEVFTTGDRIFAGFQSDPNAVRVVSSALYDANPTVQQLAAELLARMNAKSAAPELIRRMKDVTPEVQQSIIQVLGKLATPEAIQPLIAALRHSSSSVRISALQVLPQLYAETTGDHGQLRIQMRPLLADDQFEVRIQAAIALSESGAVPEALTFLTPLLDDNLASRRLAAAQALATVNATSVVKPTAALEGIVATTCGKLEQRLNDEAASVRAAACKALSYPLWYKPDDSMLAAVADHLSDLDGGVRLAAAQTLRFVGSRAASYVVAGLRNPSPTVQTAALEAITSNDLLMADALQEYAEAETARLRHYRDLCAAVPAGGRATKALTSELSQRILQTQQRLVKIIGLFGHESEMELVSRSLASHDTETQAAALEALDVLGDKRLVKTLMPLLEATSEKGGDSGQPRLSPVAAIDILLSEHDYWLNLLGCAAAAELNLSTLLPKLRHILKDNKLATREAAQHALIQLGDEMDTLPTLSLIERILLLKEVPLFAELPLDDLNQVATRMNEKWFTDRTVICEEGEQGHELFIVVSGNVRVTKRTDNGERQLAIRQAGDFIGEMSLIDSQPRSASVKAIGDVRLLVIDGNTFISILRDRPDVSLAVIRGISRRLRELGN
ncbi:MAG: HEAT repeat domain-containing protein [Anaerolineae bacterium]|nr:HEAT repeat domain-containing protein [Anaerolineae bacterium]